jgi:hypothetical protein
MQSITHCAAEAKKVVHIVEEKVYAALDAEMEQQSCHWVLDTGASNHMLGCRAAFSSINDETVGTVKFANGLVVSIEGQSSMSARLESIGPSTMCITFPV